MNGVNHIVFDMDGTLFDTSEGILECYIQVARKMDREIPDHSVLYKLIGGSLRINLKNLYGLNEEECSLAVDIYRSHYSCVGLEMSVAYPDVQNTIRELHEMGYSLSVATLKRQDFAEEFIKAKGLTPYFQSIHGMDVGDTLTKEQLIRNCITGCKTTEKATLMVGDSDSDLNGAIKNGTRFLAATWGFGFDAAFCTDNDIPYVSEFGEIIDYLRKTQ